MMTVGKEKVKALLQKDGLLNATIDVLASWEFGTFVTSCCECDKAEDEQLTARNELAKRVSNLRTDASCNGSANTLELLDGIEDAIYELERTSASLGYERAARSAATNDLGNRCNEEIEFSDVQTAIGSDILDVIMFFADKFSLVDPFDL